MVMMRSCCCLCSVRSGTVASAVYTLLLSLFNGCLVAYNIFQVREMQQSNSVLASDPALIYHIHMSYVWFYTIFVLCILLVAASVLCIVAVHLDKRKLLLPWICLTVLMVFVDTAALVYECIVFGMLSFNIFQMVIWLAVSVLNVYCLMCAGSHYHDLKNGRGTQQWYADRIQQSIIYSPAVQEVHISQGPIYMSYPETNRNPGPAVVTTIVVATTPYNTQQTVQCSEFYNDTTSSTAPLIVNTPPKTQAEPSAHRH